MTITTKRYIDRLPGGNTPITYDKSYIIRKQYLQIGLIKPRLRGARATMHVNKHPVLILYIVYICINLHMYIYIHEIKYL